MSALDDFAGRLRGLLISLDRLLPRSDLEALTRLVDHDEGGEALLTLAWIIVEQDLLVPVEAIAQLRELAAGLVDPSDLPPNLDDYTLVTGA